MKYGKRMLIGTLLITIFLINMVIPASAYVYNGCYWYAGVATVKKATSIPTGWNTSLVAASTT